MGLLIAPDDDRRRLSVYRQLSPKFSAFTHVYDFSRWHSFPDLVNLAKQGVDTANVAVTLTPHSRIGGHGATCEDTAYSHLDINGNPFATSTCTYFFVEASSKAGAIVLNSKYNADAPSESGGLQIRITSTGGVQIIKNQTAVVLEATSGRRSGNVNAIAVSVNGNNGRHAIFSNGRLIAQSTPTVTYTHGTSALFNGAAAEALQFLGPIFSFAFAPTVLPDGALIELTGNPDALFNGELGRILYFPSAGGGGATLTADSGTYTLTGTAATLKADRKLAADSGSYAITGTDVSLKLGRKLTAESGTYTVNGTDVSLTAGRKLTADSGTYALTGTDVTLTYQPAGGYTLALDSGSYTLTGTAATLKASRKLTADSGTYALTGTDVTLTRGFKITADSGTYTLTGSNVAFARTYRLPADSGSYALSGSPVSLSWSGEVVPVAPTHGGPSIYGKAVFREAEFKREYEREVSRIENERIRAIQMREDEEIVIIMAALAA